MQLRRLTSVSLGHLAIDVLNSSVAMILTALAAPFNLSNSQIGLGVMIYALVGSLSQPYFGWLADRLSGRWLGALGLLWTALFYLAATYTQSYLGLLVVMSLAALGSGAFHPQGAMNASHAGRRRASSATAVFFLLGQIGLALGPVLAGILLERSGLAGVRILAFASLPVVLLMALELNQPSVHHEEGDQQTPPRRDETPGRSASPARSRRWVVVLAFAVLVAFRATVQQGYYGLLPKFLADRGFSPSEYGLMVGLFSLTLAMGTLGGGVLGDRMDHRKLLIWTLLATTPFTFFMLNSSGAAYWILAALAGFLVGAPHSILIIMAQRLLPQRQGFASGAVLGFMFASGAAGTGLAGWIADFVDLSLVLHTVALLPLGAGLAAFFLNGARQPRAA
ncbi:MAG: MFS transporter, partial [Caldilineae bacterium]